MVSRARRLIVTEPPGYRLSIPPGELDADRFELLITEGKRGARFWRGRASRDDVRARALKLWHGTPFADFAAEPFAQAEIARLEQLRLRALEEQIEAQSSLGRHAELYWRNCPGSSISTRSRNGFAPG